MLIQLYDSVLKLRADMISFLTAIYFSPLRECCLFVKNYMVEVMEKGARISHNNINEEYDDDKMMKQTRTAKIWKKMAT